MQVLFQNPLYPYLFSQFLSNTCHKLKVQEMHNYIWFIDDKNQWLENLINFDKSHTAWKA